MSQFQQLMLLQFQSGEQLTLIWVCVGGWGGRERGGLISPPAPQTRPSLRDIGQNSDGGISDFQISGQSLVKENCHGSRTSDDINMKLGPVTKHDKRSKKPSKKYGDDFMSANCDVIIIFSIYDQFGVVRKPDSRCIVCKTYIFINGNLLSYEN